MFRHPLAKLLLLGQLALMSWMAQANPPVEVEDVMGRKVSLSLPASRIMLGFYPEDYLAVAGEGGADRLVGMSRGWFVKSRPAIWSLYVAACRNWPRCLTLAMCRIRASPSRRPWRSSPIC